jgi:hypothetical protein
VSRHGSHVFGGMLIGGAILLFFFSMSLSSLAGCLAPIALILLVVGLILAAQQSRVVLQTPEERELQWLETTLHDFEARIQARRGDQAVWQLREAYQARAMELRQQLGFAPIAAPPRPTPAPVAPMQPAPAPVVPVQFVPLILEERPVSPAVPTSSMVSGAVPTKPAHEPVPAAAAWTTPAPSPVLTVTMPAPRSATPATPAAPPRREGPVFSWQAFFSEQAGAIMFYLGGFLAIVATIVSLINSLHSYLTLGLVAGIYLGAAGLGVGLRRSVRLRTVSRVYTGLFALMTPLVALGAYILLNEGSLQVAGMVCLTALYTSIVYLALSIQTRFVPYAYLGWTALAAGLLAIVPWAGAAPEWLALALGLVALGFLGVYWLLVTLDLLMPQRVGRFSLEDILTVPAFHLAVLTSSFAMLAVEFIGAAALPGASGLTFAPAAFALAACALVGLAAGWSATIHTLIRWPITTPIDVSLAAFAAQAAVGIAFWAGAERQAMSVVLALVALAEFGGALLVRRLAAGRAVPPLWGVGLRYCIIGLALALGSLGAGMVAVDAQPNWSFCIALSALTLICTGLALADGRWWMLAAGFCLTLTYNQLLGVLFPTFSASDAPLAFLGLTLALLLLALALSFGTPTCRLIAPPLYVVALGEALLTSLLLVQDIPAGFQVGVLLALAAAAFIVGYRERAALVGRLGGNLAAGFFGALAVLPFVLHDRSGLDAVFLALGLTVTAALARRLVGRLWAVVPAALSLWALVLAVIHAGLRGVSIPDWETATHIPFVAWLLLFYSVLSFIGARWERTNAATVIQGALALWAIWLTRDPAADVQLVFALGAVGAGARMWYGRGWGSAWQVTAILASLLVTQRLGTLADGTTWQTLFLLALAVTSYLSAVLERSAELTLISLLYGLSAAWFIPADDLPRRFLLTALLAFVAAAVGLTLHLAFRRRRSNLKWAFMPYLSALGYSIFAIARAFQVQADWRAAPVLGFALVALLIAAADRLTMRGLFPPTALFLNVERIFPLTALAGGYTVAAALLLPLSDVGVGLSAGLTALVGLAGLVAPCLAEWAYRRKYQQPPRRKAIWAVPPYATMVACSIITVVSGWQIHAEWLALPVLGFALLAAWVAALRRQPELSILTVFYGLLAPSLLPAQDALLQYIWTVSLAFAAAAIGAALRLPPLRARVRRAWAFAPYAIAAGTSLLAWQRGLLAAPIWVAAVLLAFGVVAYLLALLEQEPIATILAAIYALGAAWFLPDGAEQLTLTLVMTFGAAAVGGLLRLPPLRNGTPQSGGKARREWSWALYGVAVGASLLALARLGISDRGQTEALLLVFAAVAYLLMALEDAPMAGVLPALYACAGILIQPDARALLPLAIAFAVLGMLVGQVQGTRWSWPLYTAATLAAVMTGVLGSNESGFEALALVVLAVLAYLIAASESRPELLPVALVLGALDLTAGINFFHFAPWQSMLAYIGLGVVVTLGQFLWAWLPWLRSRGFALSGFSDPRAAGVLVHRLGGLLLVGGTALVGVALPGSFAIQQPQTLVEAGALLVTGGLLALLAWQMARRLPLYLAGEMAALAISWALRWFGADNLLVFAIAPGSYQFLIGALLPADTRVSQGVRLGQLASLVGAVLLVVPTAYQALPGVSDQNTSLLYVGVLGLEALLLIGLGLGTRTRVLVLTGAGLVGVAALGGAGLGIYYNGSVSIPVIFILTAVLLMGGATWLTWRSRRDAHQL